MGFLDDAGRRILDTRQVLVDVLPWFSNYISEAKSIPISDASEIAERDLHRFQERITGLMDADRAAGVHGFYEWVDASRRQLQQVGAFTVKGHAQEREIADRERISNLLPTLTPEEFEIVGARLLSLYGIPRDQLRVTQRSNDGGFDFYGVELLDFMTDNRMRRQRHRVLGQAKRYTNKVDHDAMDAFAWRLFAFRLDTGRRFDTYEDWFRGSDLPIVGMFITTSSFTDAALSTAISAVVLTLDGRQIAQDLASSSWVDGWRGLDGEIDRELFRGFLRASE